MFFTTIFVMNSKILYVYSGVKQLYKHMVDNKVNFFTVYKDSFMHILKTRSVPCVPCAMDYNWRYQWIRIGCILDFIIDAKNKK